MSKHSPIYISDSDESDSEPTQQKKPPMFVVSDGEGSPMRHSSSYGIFDKLTTNSPVKIKQEPKLSSEEPNTSSKSPEKPFSINRERLKWLSCKIKLQKTNDIHCIKEQRQSSKSESDSTIVNSRVKCEPPDNDAPYNVKPCHVEKTTENESVLMSLAKKADVMYTSRCENKQSPLPSPLKFDKDKTQTTTVTTVTPKKKTAIDRYNSSPKKTGAFGSPTKPLAQRTLSQECFSPKKHMAGFDTRIDDNSCHIPPLHANQTSCYGMLHCGKGVVGFTSSQLGYLEGIEEEGKECTLRYIDTLLGLVTPNNKPSSDLCFRLLSETLLKSHSEAVSLKAFGALKRIQGMHPVVLEQMSRSITFEFINDVVDRLELDGCECKCHLGVADNVLCLKARNALKTLTFLVDLMEKEAKRKITPCKTIAFRLVSLERNPNNVSKVLSWINSCVGLYCSNENASDFYIILNLFQRLLQLSLSISENVDKDAENLTGELVNSYSQLHSIDCRTVFLQTLHSHLLRSKFLHLYVEVFCEKADGNFKDSTLKGIQQIIQGDLLSLPRKVDETLNFEERMCGSFHRSTEECEEHAMIIAYSLQSYLFCHHKKLQSTPKKCAMQRDDSNVIQNGRHLSITDTEEIVNMLDKVEIFVARLVSLCPSVSARTAHLFDLLTDMKLWDPW